MLNCSADVQLEYDSRTDVSFGNYNGDQHLTLHTCVPTSYLYLCTHHFTSHTDCVIFTSRQDRGKENNIPKLVSQQGECYYYTLQ
jgi:hypothetical protein